MDYKTSDFDYTLPEELIAGSPAKRRDKSRLLVLNKQNYEIAHRHFSDILKYLKPGDLLIMNNSKVIPARLLGEKETTGGKVEILLNRETKDNIWEVIGKNLKVGSRIRFGSSLSAVVLERDGQVFKLFFNKGGDKFFDELDKIGQVPLPPYIERTKERNHLRTDEEDRERYQTVYAKERGSVAAPTAGLHFTPELLDEIRALGIETAELTLHVGLGTFMPLKSENISEHKMHSEYYAVSTDLIDKIKQCKAKGGRIIAVGTTTTRVLESIFGDEKTLRPNSHGVISGSTNIFIHPPYKFRIVDGLITNFHLPKSTLLMLISALASKENIDRAYIEAIKEKYRFYSYGDAMLII